MNKRIRDAAGRASVLAQLHRATFSLCALVVILASLTFGSSAAWAQVTLQQGDIVVVNGVLGPCVGNTCTGGAGAIVLVRPGSPQQIITSNDANNLLPQPVGVIADPNDSNLLVTDRLKGVIRVDPFTGLQTSLSSGGLFKDPFGIVVDNFAQIWVADSGLRGTCDSNGLNCLFQVNAPGQVILVNRTTGTQGNAPFATGGYIKHPYGIAYDPILNLLYVSSYDDVNRVGTIVAVDPTNTTQATNQKLIFAPAALCAASGNPACVSQTSIIDPGTGLPVPLACPMGLTVEGSGNILATTFNYPPYGCPNAGVFRVNLMTHQQESLQSNPPINWLIPFGIATMADGTILVVDEGYGALYHLSSAGVFMPPIPFASGGFLSTFGGGGPNALNIVQFSPTPHTAINGAPSSSPEGTAITLTSTVSGTTYAWSVTKNGNPFASGSASSLGFTPDDNGTYVVNLSVTNSGGTIATPSKTITVTNVAPTVAINGAPASGVVGAAISLTSSVSDPSSADTAAGFTYAWSVTRNGSPFTTGTASTLSFTPNASGSYVTTLTAKDKDLATGTAPSKTVNVVDVTPIVSIIGAPVSSAEGTAITLTSTVSGAGTLTYLWGVTKNGSPFASSSGTSLTFTPNDNGTYVATLAVTNSGGTGNASVSIAVTNVAPTITSVTGPAAPLAAPATVSITASFTDPGVLDTHTCTFNWNDGTTSTGGVTESNGSGSCTMSHSFSTADVYTITVTVADHDGGSTPGYYKYVVVYNPAAGWVSGLGQFTSPAGSYPANPLISATSNFGFIVGYLKGSSTPIGISVFQFKLATLKLLSTSYQYLTINGGTAQFKGTGTVKLKTPTHPQDGVFECDDNHYHSDCDDDSKFQVVAGTYSYIVTAVDGSATGGTIDRYRIKITNASGVVIYDNLIGAGDDPGTFTAPAIKNGRVVVHTN